MIIQVRFEKDYDSKDFFSEADPEDLSKLTFHQFKEEIINEIYECPNEIINSLTFKIVK
jgi:hypothetical protein